ncbi:GGDEF domain-containing protein [[Clostridium] colinum]|uniref:GGDEF domain-containing protein n=1 Tax=[Clostridium] colinum TaxID=36835 RepID=UPI002024EFE7|nr:GGDEF domain-containing protein [[Clostridium] colinum]
MNRIKKNKKLKVTFLYFFRICVILAMILHLLFSILFFADNIKILGIFNIFSVILYLSLTIYLNYNKDSITLATIITFFEVCLHMLLCIYFIGWQGGFYVYPLCMIPAIYFVTINVLRKEIYGHIIVGLTFIIYQVSKIYAGSRIATFQQEFMYLSEVLYTFNTVSASFLFSFLTYGFLSEMRDIQEDLQCKNKILKNIVNIDTLTGIYNRRGMNEKIKRQIEQFKYDNKVFSIGICDIDNFKRINDTYGHDCGDIILKAIADILINNSKKYNIKVCRWGGEEFLILIKDNILSSNKICESILDDVREYCLNYNDESIKVTMTIGLAEFNNENDKIDKVLKNADINLYKGKSSTKNCVVLN